MITLSPALLVAAASSLVGAEPTYDSALVDLFLREVRQPPGQPWSAAFVHHVGFWSHYDHRIARSTWPLPATASCLELGEFARVRGALKREPSVGDVFLEYTPALKRFIHAGIIVSLDGARATPHGDTRFVCTTVEGRANAVNPRESRIALVRARHFSSIGGDRFIRWADLELRAAAA